MEDMKNIAATDILQSDEAYCKLKLLLRAWHFRRVGAINGPSTHHQSDEDAIMDTNVETTRRVRNFFDTLVSSKWLSSKSNISF
jgi:hypothetical protein